MRQLHLEVLLTDARFCLVLRGHVLDFRGIDLLAIREGRAVGIQSSAGTSRTAAWKQAKRWKADQAVEVHLPMIHCEHPTRTVGAFRLHDTADVDRIRQALCTVKE